jgi:Helix-turn-helix domain
MVELKKGSRITGAARDKLGSQLVKQYEKGASIRALAEETGRSYGFVHRVLSESRVMLRGRGGATRTKKKQTCTCRRVRVVRVPETVSVNAVSTSIPSSCRSGSSPVGHRM